MPKGKTTGKAITKPIAIVEPKPEPVVKHIYDWDEEDWERFREEMKLAVDQQLADQIGAGIVVGVRKQDVSPERARMLKPILSSDNPSMVWSKTQGYAMSHKGDMEEALAFYENALLHAAEAAFVNQKGQTLPSGNICNWPTSPFASLWIRWCIDNYKNIRKNLDEQVYNLNKGYNLWMIGELSTGIIEGRIAVATKNVNGRYTELFYPEKNWYD